MKKPFKCECGFTTTDEQEKAEHLKHYLGAPDFDCPQVKYPSCGHESQYHHIDGTCSKCGPNGPC